MIKERPVNGVIKFLIGVAFGMLIVGCGEQRNESLPQLHVVTGTVKCDGAPLEKGEIIFEGKCDAELALAPPVAAIVNGTYEAAVGQGTKTVRISSPTEVGKPDVTGVRAIKETIAPAFNTQSTITVEISPGDGNQFDFDVKSR